MFMMTAIDIFTPPFLGSSGIVFAYMMNDPYQKPAITLTIFFEAAVAVYGFYIFCIVWGCTLSVKNKPDKVSVGVQEAPKPVAATAAV
jgi:hypothetical protein